MGSSRSQPVPPTCDVAVIGAGITGALVADTLSREGLSVLVLDKRAPACGSTAASTSLLSYEIDVSLVKLADMIGLENAVRAYRASARAIDDLAELASSLVQPCGFRRQASMQLATRRKDTVGLEKEADLRQHHGLDAEFWPRARIEETYGFPSYGGLHTGLAGVLDPVCFTRALLHRATSAGAVLLPRTPARDIRDEGTHLLVVTDGGESRANWVVYAMGYEMPASLRAGMVALHSTYALVTEPLEDLGLWGGRSIVWETARPYFYMRATDDQRVMIGGADAPFKDADWRDRLMPDRRRRLEKTLEKLLPTLTTETAFVWAGTFGETADGLPYIGPMASCPRALYALGYGANGITFGAVAARIVRDLCLGRPNEDADLFRLDR